MDDIRPTNIPEHSHEIEALKEANEALRDELVNATVDLTAFTNDILTYIKNLREAAKKPENKACYTAVSDDLAAILRGEAPKGLDNSFAK